MNHLPECPCPTMAEDDWYCCQSCNPDVTSPWERACICDALRACEQRAWQDGFVKGQRQGERDMHKWCRDAVEKVGQQHPKWDLISTHYEGCWKSHPECALTLALAAIDALRGEA